MPDAELYELLPHRPPMLLVDRITAGVTGEWIETVTEIDGSEPCFAELPGSVPRVEYAYPAVLVLESFVQSAALLWAKAARAGGQPADGTLVFGGARDVVFHRCVFPGDSLCHRARFAGRVGSNAFVAGETTLRGSGEPVLTVGSIALSTRPAAQLGGAAPLLGASR